MAYDPEIVNASGTPCPFCHGIMTTRGVRGQPNKYSNPLYPTKEHLIPISDPLYSPSVGYIIACMKCNNDKGGRRLRAWHTYLVQMHDVRAAIVQKFMEENAEWELKPPPPEPVKSSLYDRSHLIRNSSSPELRTNQRIFVDYFYELTDGGWVSSDTVTDFFRTWENGRLAGGVRATLAKLHHKGWLILKERVPLELGPPFYRLAPIVYTDPEKYLP